MTQTKRSSLVVPVINARAAKMMEKPEWSPPLVAKLGTLMVHLAIKSARFVDESGEEFPVFVHGYQYIRLQSNRMKVRHSVNWSGRGYWFRMFSLSPYLSITPHQFSDLAHPSYSMIPDLRYPRAPPSRA